MNWFLEGVLVMVPLLITSYIFYVCIRFVSALLRHVFGLYLTKKFPSLDAHWQLVIFSLFLVFFIVTLVGAFTQLWIGRHVIDFMDRVIARTPLVKLVYTGLRDGMKTLFIDRKKFDRPVMIKLSGIRIPGFITQECAKGFGLTDYMAVYLPSAFSIAGRVVLVHKGDIEFFDQKASVVMAFLISGGLTSKQMKP